MYNNKEIKAEPRPKIIYLNPLEFKMNAKFLSV